MKDLLLVIDIQNVYFPEHPWACPTLPRTVDNVKKLLDSPACGQDFDVLFTQYLASQEPQGCWAQYNSEYSEINEDSHLSEIADTLKPYLTKWPLREKNTYSSCYIPEVRDAVLRYNRIILTGVVAECCILSTMMALIDEGARVCYLKDAISGQSQEWEDQIEKIAASFAPIHVEILDTEEYLKLTEKTAENV